MISRIISAITTLILIFSIGFTSYASEEPTLIKMHATAYCLQGITASGKPVRKGICASGYKDWIGKTVIVYQRLPGDEVGRLIGIYEIEDTGCKESVLDIWMPDLDECQDFMNTVYENGCKGKVYAQIITAAG